jgi:AcrR family transcriptional regulator
MNRMNGLKNDRRIKYTKMMIKQSLVKLLQEKPISKISVKEICETADINRSTFYAHYSDQYDLLRQVVDETMQDLNAYLGNYNFKAYEPESFQIMNRIFEYIVENAELCKVLLGENGDISLQKEIMMIVQRQGMKEWTGKKAVDADIMEYLYLFFVNASIGIIHRWLQGGLKQSAREMADLVLKLIYEGLSPFMK